ncbi:MAG: Hpt domain-containing protein [Pirellulaceae bacterium]
MISATIGDSFLYSDLGDDPDYAELIEMFVGDLPRRVEQLLAAKAAEDADQVRVLSHRLRGAAGGYGFPQLTHAAARVEEPLRSDQPLDSITGELDTLIDLCQRVRIRSTDKA